MADHVSEARVDAGGMRDAILLGEGNHSGLNDLNLAVRIAQVPDDADRPVRIRIKPELVVEAFGQGVAGVQVRVRDQDLLLNLVIVLKDGDDIPPREALSVVEIADFTCGKETAVFERLREMLRLGCRDGRRQRPSYQCSDSERA